MTDDRAAALADVERHVLWLATSIVHAANIEHDPSGLKTGGHQSSSASMVSLMTALWCGVLDGADQVSVKPHASPVMHALNYVLGGLDASYLPRLRRKGGLQPYPSRTKDPDRADFSTGSVGIGATATIWAAIADRYLASHGHQHAGGRYVALVGDAELDEGAVWEAVADPAVSDLGELLWVVDLNRQSLDRVVPGIQVAKWQGMFAAAGWQVVTVKYGRALQKAFGGEGGEALRERIDGMDNEEYQFLLRAPESQVRAILALDLPQYDDAELTRLVRDLGGHDLAELTDAFATMDPTRPTVVFAYTIKGWGLPTQGHPSNHSQLLSDEQYAQLATSMGFDAANPWARPEADSPAGRLLAERAAVLHRPKPALQELPPVPDDLGRRHGGTASTQAAFGRFWLDLQRSAPELAKRVVTVSPDVASSTNLGGWINKVGVWNQAERQDWFADDPERLVKWREGVLGQHLELGIAEVNLVGLMGELGATWSRHGEPLVPVGTLYDPFLARALEPWQFGLYAGGQSIIAGTPSGVTLAAEGGAHQSIVTPSIGLAQPGVTAWEPAYGQDLEWMLLDAVANIAQDGGESAYVRLSTRPVEQLSVPPENKSDRRADVLRGGYVLQRGTSGVTLVGMGAVMPEVLAAAEALRAAGEVSPSVVVVTSADRLFRAWRAGSDLAWLFPRGEALVTVLDGHPSALAWLGSVTGGHITTLGVTEFGQAGWLSEVQAVHGIDSEAVVAAAYDAFDG